MNPQPAPRPRPTRFEWDTATLQGAIDALQEAADHIRAHFAEQDATHPAPCHITLQLPTENRD